MSNKIVPQIYRAIIDDVIANVAVDFEEYGMDDDLLPMLQAKWESKLLETRVADFARAPGAEDPPASSTAGASTSAAAVPQNGNSDAAPAAPPAGADVRVKSEPEDVLRLRGGSGNEDLSSVASYNPPKPEPNAAGLLPGDEVIDSDLDDSDDELGNDDDGEDGEGEVDIVFCVYDKVARVKNKWKTVFKDGMIHINGRDYLFTKCQGEFEW